METSCQKKKKKERKGGLPETPMSKKSNETENETPCGETESKISSEGDAQPLATEPNSYRTEPASKLLPSS